MARNSFGSTLAWAVGLILVSGLAAATWAMFADGRAPRPRARVVHPAPERVAPVSEIPDPVAPPPSPIARPEPVVRPPARRPRRPRGRAPLSPVMQAVLSDPQGTEQVLIDVARVRDSAPGRAIYNCLPAHEFGELEELKARSGFDPIEQIERFGFAGNLAALQGDFGDVDFSKIDEGFEREDRDGAAVYTHTNGRRRFAVIDDRYLVLGEFDAVEAALERVRTGETEGAPQLIADVSGRLPLHALFNMLPAHRKVRMPLNQMLAEAGGGLDVRIDVSDAGADVRLSMQGVDPMIREAVAAGVDAMKNGGVAEGTQQKLAPLIDGMQVDQGDDGLTLRTPVTMEFLEGMLGECVHQDRR